MSCSAIVDRPCVAVPRALHERTVPLGSDRMCIGASLMSIEDNLRLDADTCKDADVAADLERMCGIFPIVFLVEPNAHAALSIADVAYVIEPVTRSGPALGPSF